MRAGNCIRYYQSFPSVIPVCRASSLRVTHPSALARLCKHRFAKDLHVLSILSAFILSQDQTLHSIYFSHIFSFHLFFVLWQRFLFTQNLFASLLLLLILFPIVLAYLCGWQKLYYQIYSLLSIPFFIFFTFFLSPLYSFILPLLPLCTIYLLLFSSQILYIVLFPDSFFLAFFFCFSFCLFFKAFRVFLFDYLNLL